ncbi:MAG: DnaJ domain-containing protein [Nitratireductor sp.]|nr:DnaJ domain-containing protein [Nitratireductor sp.]
MSIFLGFFLLVFLVASIAALMLTTPAAKLAAMLRAVGPVTVMLAGGVMLLIGRAALGVPLIGMGLAWWSRNRKLRPLKTESSGQSTVRSAMLEMTLDHDSGEMDGLVLTGSLEGRMLSSISLDGLADLYRESLADPESASLLEAYLDRRSPFWREHAHTDADPGQRRPSGSGAMTKEEAYQVLGLSAGAGPDKVREAHRRLMKRLHPDNGGSTFLAAKINQAKDILID